MKKKVIIFILFILGWVVGHSQDPPPSISPSGTRSICLGDSLRIDVTSLSGGTYVFKWLKDGQPITDSTRSSIVVKAAGVYSVDIKKNDESFQNFGSLTLLINPSPNANFTFDPSSGCGKTTVRFTNTSDNGNAGQTSNLTYQWNFGNGKSSTQKDPDPVRFSPPPGSGFYTFNIKLITKNSQTQCSDTIFKELILGRGSDASLTSDAEIKQFNKEPYFTVCNAISSNISFFNATTVTNSQYIIDWGDGSPLYSNSTFTNLIHQYNVGTHKLTLIAKGGACSDTSFYNIFVGSNPSISVGNPGNTTILCTGDSLRFPISGTENNPPGTLYKFTVNDGSDTIILTHPAPPSLTIRFNKSSCNVFSNYNNSFKLDVLAINPCGFSPVTVNAIYVSQKPKPDFSITPSPIICTNTTVLFKNIGITGETIDQNAGLGDCNRGKLLWEISGTNGTDWVKNTGDLGIDPGSPNNINPWTTGSDEIGIKFINPGNYTVKLKMGSVRCGISDTIKTICVNPTPVVSLDLDKVSICQGESVAASSFANNSPSCGTYTYSWTAELANVSGCAAATQPSIVGQGTGSATYTFSTPGIYNVVLTVTAPGGCIVVKRSQVEVKGKPVVSLNAINPFCASGTVSPIANISCYATGASYSWTFTGGTPTGATTSNPSVTYATSGNYTIALDVTNTCGVTSAQQTVTVKPVPSVNSVGNISVCAGVSTSAVNFSSSLGGSTFSWTNSNSTIGLGASGTGAIPVFNAVNNTLSSITANLSVTPTLNGCSGTPLNFTITVLPKPSVNITGGGNTCINQPLTLTANITANGTGANYSWSPTSSTASSITITPSTSGTINYTVTVTNSDGCVNTASSSITTNALPTVTVNPSSVSVCIGSSVSLIASGAASYSWSPSTGLSSSTGSNVSASPTTNTTYTVTGTNGPGCTSSATTTVTVNPLPVVIVNSPTMCFGIAASLNASGADTYIWTPSTGLSATSGATINANPANTTSYTVTGRNSTTTCVNTSTALVTVNPLPIITVNSPTICPGVSTTLTASGALTYSWTPSSNLSSSTGDAVTASPTNTTTYQVTGTDNNLCSKSVTSIVTVTPLPTISATKQDPTTCGGSNGTITVSGLNNGTTYNVKYTYLSVEYTRTGVASGGAIIISGLSSGTYTNIYVTFSGCNSTSIGPYTLSDPTAPTAPTLQTSSTICSGQNLVLSVSNPIPGALYTWTGPGLNSSLLNQTNITIQNAPISAAGTYQVTASLNSCVSAAGSINVNVNPTPSIPIVVNVPYCQGESPIQLSASYDASNTLYWYTSATGGSSSLTAPTPSTASAGTTSFYVSQITPASASCESKRVKLDVIVSPIPVILVTKTDPLTCSGANGSLVITGFSANTFYQVFYKKNGSPISISLQADATGKIIITGLTQGDYSEIYVTLGSCTSNIVSTTFQLRDPLPPVQPILSSNSPICSGNTLTLTVTNPVAGATYDWVGPNGFTQPGSLTNVLNRPSSTLLMKGPYSVTMTLANCISQPASLDIIVNQTPSKPMVSDPPPYCQGATAVELTADIVPGNIINWYSPGSVVPSGPTGPTPSTSTVGSVTYYVSQTTSTEGCESQRAPIVVTVSTTPFIADKTLTNCSEAAISFTPSEAPIGTQYTWATPLIVPSGAIFGATGQTSPTNSFTQSLRNLTNVNATSEYIITPSVGTCPGPDFNILVTVEPKAFIADETINAICSGESINFTPTTSGSNIIPSNTLYKWTVVSIIPAGSIINATSQTIPSASLSQTLTNISSVTARIVYAITPVSGNCTGPAFTLTVDVNPKPKIQDIPLTICSGQTFNAVILNNPPGIIVPAATSYTWPTPTSTGPNAISGGSAQLIGSSFISQTLVNSTISTQTLTYIVTPTTGSCSGPNFRVIVTVNPQPNIAPKKEIVCSGTAFSIVPSDAPIGTLYTWTIPTVEAPGNISGAIAQTSPVSTISQLLTNNKNYPAKVTYNVSPSSGSCGGSGFSVEIIVNPKPFIPTLKDTICNGEIFSIIPVNGVSSAIVPDLTTYTWVLPTSLPNGTITGGSAQPTSQTSIQQTLFNASDAPGILNYRVTPVSGSFGNCPGPVFSVSVMVNPDAKARFTPTDTIGCPPYLINANRVGLQQFTQRNNEYIWYIDGQLNGTGTGLPNFKILNEDDTIQLKLVTTSLYGCKSDSAFKKFITYKLPHPEFSVSENDDCGPYTVSFVNNTPDKQVFRYNWTFGNGLTSSKSDPDPVQFLPNPSFGDTIYTVRLDVTSVCNIVSYEQKIRVKSKPKALFSPTSTIGCSPFKVVFNNTSRGVNNRYVWDFGDGRKDSVLIRDTISHIYYTSVRDTFIVKLYAINECGIDSSSYNIIVSPNTIKLDFAVNGEEKEGCIQHTVRFINNTSGASAFRWNFGDGNTRSTIKNIDTVSHTYLQPGKYTITLFATNGCTDTLSTEEVTVYGLPTPDFGVSKFNVCIGDSIFFKNKSTNADSYLWDLGDGKRVTFVDPGHRYANKGTYQVKLFVFKTNSPGIVCVDSIVRTINIVDTVNVAFDVSDSVSNCAPFRVVFNNFYRDNIYAEWNFGDGIKLRGDSVTHIFNKTGRFDVKLYVKAIGGCNYIGSKPITINSPTGTASFKSGYSCIDESIRFEAIPFATDSILWDFGDGILLKTDKRVVYHQYQNPGVYVPTITLLSNLGCAFKVDISDTIKIDKVIGGFSYLQEEFCGYTRVDFKDTTNAFFGKAKVEWKFGDGESGGLFKQPHNFKSSNTYLVESIVTAVSGCSDTSYRNVPVFVRSIPAVQIGGDTVSCTGKDLKLQAFVKSQDSITLQKWITSNGSIVYGDTYKNIYAQPASYIFSFISGTKYGCYDTTKVTLNIYPTPIVKAAPDVTICQGNSITINATGADTYSWYPSEGLSCINCKDPVASPDKATPYTVKGTTKYGCYAYDTILVKVIPKIKIEATKNDSICIGESLQLLASGAKYYEWSPSIGLSATDIQNPIASPTRTTRYRVVGFDEYSCFRDTAFVLIGVGGYPKVDLGPDQLLATGSLFQLKPKFTEGPIKTWSWGPDKDLSCINCASPIARVRNQITYFVTATNYYGCSGSDTISIKVFCENAQVYIPNAFTPDNDGNNDIFMVRASGIQEVKSFRIFNRWGELLFDKANFQPNDPSFAWDGRIRGVIPGPDVFVYTVEVICDDGTPYFYKGNVSLLK